MIQAERRERSTLEPSTVSLSAGVGGWLEGVREGDLGLVLWKHLLWRQTGWILILILPFTACVTLSKSPL